MFIGWLCLEIFTHSHTFTFARTSPDVGAEWCSDAVALRVKVVANLHRVTWLALVDVVVGGRLGEEGVTSSLLPHAFYPDLVRLDKHARLGRVHECPHALEHGNRGRLQRQRFHVCVCKKDIHTLEQIQRRVIKPIPEQIDLIKKKNRPKRMSFNNHIDKEAKRRSYCSF